MYFAYLYIPLHLNPLKSLKSNPLNPTKSHVFSIFAIFSFLSELAIRKSNRSWQVLGRHTPAGPVLSLHKQSYGCGDVVSNITDVWRSGSRMFKIFQDPNISNFWTMLFFLKWTMLFFWTMLFVGPISSNFGEIPLVAFLHVVFSSWLPAHKNDSTIVGC